MGSDRRYPRVHRDFSSREQLALRASGQVTDPSEDLAQQYAQVGRRLADPYAARAAAEAHRLATQRTLSAGVRVGSDALYRAPDVRGWRTTQMGTYGRLTGHDRQPWDARGQAGFTDGGVRGPGYSEELARAEKNRWQSGRLQQGSMTIRPTPERPFLMIRCPDTSGNGTSSIQLRIPAGAGGGAETSREFFVGGGFPGSFLLDGYSVVRVEIIQSQNPGIDRIEWAWEISGVQAGDQSLYLPQVLNNPIAPAATIFAVPEGAFQVAWGDAGIGNVTWINPLFAKTAFEAAPLSFAMYQVAGSQFSLIAAQTTVVWRLRPI